ncbi:MAG: SUMF1/EgtB/PvdO family nonheme iron enzyme [Fuerstia sp.]|nr:SUMF1/EgtB/PvdO family nonheme iron enzyme [Fuerstiella sp.]
MRHKKRIGRSFAIATREVTVEQYQLRPVASLRPNDLGLFDTLGNVMEWCQDTC